MAQGTNKTDRATPKKKRKKEGKDTKNFFKDDEQFSVSDHREKTNTCNKVHGSYKYKQKKKEENKKNNQTKSVDQEL